MPINSDNSEKKEAKRPKKLTKAAITKEKKRLSELFEAIEDEDKKTLVNSVIEEAAFLKVALLQAKEEIQAEGLTAETKNASQHFIKAHPSTAIYKDYARQYTQIINQLIDYLPPKEKKKTSKLAALRDE